MASSSPFSNSGKFQILPTQTAVVFTQPGTNSFTINNVGNATQNIRQANIQNGTFYQPQTISNGTLTSPASVVRLNPALTSQTQLSSPTLMTNSSTALASSSPKPSFGSTIKTEPLSPSIQQQQPRLVTQPIVRQAITTQQTPKFTETQINDFVGKCRTFLTTLLKLAEKQAPEKLPMVQSCIQDLLDGSIDPESFTQRLHTLYKSQPHTSLVPFFKLALPYMRQMVKNTFGQPITIALLERLPLPPTKTNTNTNNTNTLVGTGATTTSATVVSTPSRVVVNPSLLSQPSTSAGQPLLYTTVQPQQKLNLLSQPNQPPSFNTNPSLLGQQQQQQQARAQINIAGIRPLFTTVSASNSNLLTGQSQQIQPVAQTIIQQSDSILQRPILSSSTTGTTTIQQPQIITVNHQPIRTDLIANQSTTITNLSSLQQSSFQLQQKTIIKNEDDLEDDFIGNTGQLVSTSGPTDDRNTRHINHDKRLLPAHVLRQRFEHLIKKNKRWEASNMTIHDDSVYSLLSHATEIRLKCLTEQIRLFSQKRLNLAQENRSEIVNNNDGTLLSIDDKRKRTFSDNTADFSSNMINNNKKLKLTKQKGRANLHDLIFIMEKDKALKRSTLFYKAKDNAYEKL